MKAVVVFVSFCLTFYQVSLSSTDKIISSETVDRFANPRVARSLDPWSTGIPPYRNPHSSRRLCLDGNCWRSAYPDPQCDENTRMCRKKRSTDPEPHLSRGVIKEGINYYLNLKSCPDGNCRFANPEPQCDGGNCRRGFFAGDNTSISTIKGRRFCLGGNCRMSPDHEPLCDGTNCRESLLSRDDIIKKGINAYLNLKSCPGGNCRFANPEPQCDGENCRRGLFSGDNTIITTIKGRRFCPGGNCRRSPDHEPLCDGTNCRESLLSRDDIIKKGFNAYLNLKSCPGGNCRFANPEPQCDGGNCRRGFFSGDNTSISTIKGRRFCLGGNCRMSPDHEPQCNGGNCRRGLFSGDDTSITTIKGRRFCPGGNCRFANPEPQCDGGNCRRGFFSGDNTSISTIKGRRFCLGGNCRMSPDHEPQCDGGNCRRGFFSGDNTSISTIKGRRFCPGGNCRRSPNPEPQCNGGNCRRGFYSGDNTSVATINGSHGLRISCIDGNCRSYFNPKLPRDDIIEKEINNYFNRRSCPGGICGLRRSADPQDDMENMGTVIEPRIKYVESVE